MRFHSLHVCPDKMSGWWGVVSALLDTKLPHRPVRKWPPGCSALLNRIDPMQDDASSVLGCWSSSVAKNENFGFRSDLQMCGAPNQTSSKGYLHKHVSRKKTSSNQPQRPWTSIVYSSIATVSFQSTNELNPNRKRKQKRKTHLCKVTKPKIWLLHCDWSSWIERPSFFLRPACHKISQGVQGHGSLLWDIP